MKLFLASEAKYPQSIEKLRKFLNKSFSELKILYIPTAANGEYYGAWKGGQSIKTAMSLGASLKIVELEDSSYINVISDIKDSDIIWMAGGMSGYLLYWIRRTELDKVLPEILDKGTIYVGSSAGSMICSKTQYSAEWYIGEPEPGAGLVPGLGFVDFEIYPHYQEQENFLPQIKRLWKGRELYLLKDGEVITVVNDVVKVLGRKRIIYGRK